MHEQMSNQAEEILDQFLFCGLEKRNVDGIYFYLKLHANINGPSTSFHPTLEMKSYLCMAWRSSMAWYLKMDQVRLDDFHVKYVPFTAVKLPSF